MARHPLGEVDDPNESIPIEGGVGDDLRAARERLDRLRGRPRVVGTPDRPLDLDDLDPGPLELLAVALLVLDPAP